MISEALEVVDGPLFRIWDLTRRQHLLYFAVDVVW